jgi:iron-sulfur cluster assembly accessory protein
LQSYFNMIRQVNDGSVDFFASADVRSTHRSEQVGLQRPEWSHILKVRKSKRRVLMATATITPTPEVVTGAPKSQPPVTLTPAAIAKVREIMATQDPIPAGLRIGVVGGGCSGFQYSMSFENQSGMMDKVFTFDGLKVFVDATSAMYLSTCVVDYVETLEAAGFKFENAAVKSTCGCGSSFSV